MRGRGRPIVAVSRRLPPLSERRLAERFDVRLNEADAPRSPAELAEAMRTADALVPTVTDRVDADVLGAEPRRVRIVANYGAGTNHIDLEAARARGIVVTNTPDVLTEDTADLTMALLLAVARRTGEGERLVRDGAWQGWAPTHHLGRRVTGRTLGIVGFGRIGRAVAARAHHGFRMRVLYHQPRPVPESAARAVGAVAARDLSELLAQSDFVSIHCPARPETRHLIDAARLGEMKPRAYLINTARGDVVDENALVDAVARGRIAGAGLDVYEREPALAEGLRSLESVVLLPHLGSATVESREAMGARVLENLEAFFQGRAPRDVVG